MEAVFDNFDLYLRAFWLTIGLFLVSGVASLILGTLLAALRVGPVAVLARLGAVYVTVVRNTPLLMIFVFGPSRCPSSASPSAGSGGRRLPLLLPPVRRR